MPHRLARAILADDDGERPVELNNVEVVGAEGPDALDEHLQKREERDWWGQSLGGQTSRLACVRALDVATSVAQVKASIKSFQVGQPH